MIESPQGRRFACDVHTHTLYSQHAYSTIEENVRTAAERGIELLGSADHFSNMLFPDRVASFYQYYNNYRVWPREWHGVKVLHGAEADIVNLRGELYGEDILVTTSVDGGPCDPLTLQEYVFRRCDYVIASIHNKWFCRDASLAQTTEMYINALAHPKVLILGHPGRPGVPFDIDAVLEAARAYNKLIEINEYSFTHLAQSRDMCVKIIERCAETGTPISVSTDAHISAEVGDYQVVPKLLDEMDFPPELIATRSAETFLAAIAQVGIAPAEECPPLLQATTQLCRR